ncbi:MAG TPA: radical SAM protein [Deltaproteobacteria bacterium]|nr:radical SAM protein [Deltaproteobacteria bacterium]HOS27973.1 radical SAM protein [Deltaproteobacteria bacterium]HRT44262.1 radical SAM protein [Desulfomonilia bacterium]
MSADTPNMVFADRQGNIMDFEGLGMVGRTGDYLVPVSAEETIALPRGSQLYVLPDRYPIGVDRRTGEIVVLKKNPYDGKGPVFAVATFLCAAHTQTYLAAWERRPDACALPLYAYTALGWSGGFVATAIRTDLSRRQDPDLFSMDRVKRGIAAWREEFPQNRLVEHLSHCALVYGCPAALNLFQGREEAPLPTSPACNARCAGCISFQEGCEPPSPQQRISFVPTAHEIAEVALTHISRVDDPVVSFGQGCEGEPLMVHEVLLDAVRLIRKKTDRGTINLNTNASMPEKVAELADAGLDSVRISMNSARPATYRAYFRPTYDFGRLAESAFEMKKRERFVSINLFVFPGVTDAPKEAQALKDYVAANRIDMVQWRNLNMDPDAYLDILKQPFPSGIGVKRLIEEIPVRRGYFNPYIAPRR